MNELESQRSGGLRPGTMMPEVRVLSDRHKAPRSLPSHSRDALVLFSLPAAVEPWSSYLSELDRAREDVQHWYSEIIVVAADERALEEVKRSAPGLTGVVEEAPVLRGRLGVAEDQGVLVVVDRYGQIYEVVAAAPGGLPGVREVEEWARFLATQCPECGVIDEPGHGEWSTL